MSPIAYRKYTAERDAAAQLVDALGGGQRITLGAEKNYDTQGFVRDMREMKGHAPRGPE
jgi:hypothetical protein